jgi:hypothetical protein
MPLSAISSVSGGLNQSINPKPKGINIQTIAGPFSTTITGNSDSYNANVSNNITTGNIYNQGIYSIKCSYWITEGSTPNFRSSLGMICDNNTNTYCTSSFTSNNNLCFNYNGIQLSSNVIYQYSMSYGTYLGRDETTYNQNSSVSGNFIDFIFPKNILINTYSFIQRQDDQNTLYRTPLNLYILGSTDGSTWTLISQYTNTNTASNTWTNISLKSSSSINPYSYIRMVINSIQSTSLGLWNIAEINMTYNIA